MKKRINEKLERVYIHTDSLTNKIKNYIKKIIMREKYNSDTYIQFLRKLGVKIGENCTIYVPSKTEIDITNPFMLEIGDNVKITTGVKILTHDFSWSVTSGLDGFITGSIGAVSIGNNVFIGMGSIITRNVEIGDNVIIGAGSVVTHNCESNSVYAGIPAKKIMSIEDYHKKRKIMQVEDAKKLAITYYNKTGKLPDRQILREFLFLFENDIKKDEKNIAKILLKDSGHYEECLKTFTNNKPQFKDINDFLKFCGLLS